MDLTSLFLGVYYVPPSSKNLDGSILTKCDQIFPFYQNLIHVPKMFFWSFFETLFRYLKHIVVS